MTCSQLREYTLDTVKNFRTKYPGVSEWNYTVIEDGTEGLVLTRTTVEKGDVDDMVIDFGYPEGAQGCTARVASQVWIRCNPVQRCA
jgi:hypothetical protein